MSIYIAHNRNTSNTLSLFSNKMERYLLGNSTFFGRPFVKRFALCYETVVCLSCLSVTFVHCGQTVGRINMKFGMLVGLGPGHIALDGDPAPPPQKGQSPQFLTHVCCGQMAAGIKVPVGTEVGLGPGTLC